MKHFSTCAGDEDTVVMFDRGDNETEMTLAEAKELLANLAETIAYVEETA